jgi:hypothetical protein
MISPRWEPGRPADLLPEASIPAAASTMASESPPCLLLALFVVFVAFSSHRCCLRIVPLQSVCLGSASALSVACASRSPLLMFGSAMAIWELKGARIMHENRERRDMQ